MSRTNPYKVFALILSIFFLASCSKDDGTTRPVDDTPQWKKLKRTYASYTGGRTEITDFTYDTNGRLIQHDFLREDTSTVPVTIIFSEKTTLTYEGENEYPSSATIVRSNGKVYSATYSYDNQSRVTREELQYQNNVEVRSDYTYINPSLVRVSEYHEGFIPGTNYTISDSFYFDAENRVTEGRHNEPNLSYSFNFDYDTKNNAYSGITAFKHVFTLNGSTRVVPRRSPNNVTHYQSHATTSPSTEDHVINYVYDAESYPVSCHGRIEWTLNSTDVQEYDTKFEYY